MTEKQKRDLKDTFKGDNLAEEVFMSKYSLNKKESPTDTIKRLSSSLSRVEKSYYAKLSEKDLKELPLSKYGLSRALNHLKGEKSIEEIYWDLLKDFNTILLGGSSIEAMGTNKLQSLSNCFVCEIPDDNIESIFNSVTGIAEIGKRRGGTATDLSNLRPRGSAINNAAKESTGAVSWLELYNTIGKLIGQNNRNTAMMITMDVNHPDVQEFITIKQDLTKVTKANLSIKITDEFIKAVKEDSDYILRYPCNTDLNLLSKKDLDVPYNTLTFIDNMCYVKRVRAKELWDTIVNCAHNTGEPGVLFWDKMVNYDPTGVYNELKPVSTNPCIPEWVKVYTPEGIKCLRDIKIGEIIWSKEGWTTVTNIVASGIKPVFRYCTKYGNMYCTSNHRIVTSEGKTQAHNAKNIEFLGHVNPDIHKVIEHPEIMFSEKHSEEMVWDVTVDNESHTFWCDGFNICNCGELALAPLDSCRLISTNLYSLVKEAFTPDAYVVFQNIYRVFYEAQCMADNIVDLELEAIDKILCKINSEWEIMCKHPIGMYRNAFIAQQSNEFKLWLKIKEIGSKGRRTGTGILGLGDMYAALGENYGAKDITDRIFEFKLQAELDATIDMAIIKGAFPLWDKNKEFEFDKDGNALRGKNSWYDMLLKEFPDQYKAMVKYGRRNAGISAIAPTGTLGIIAGVTSGIEPLFKPFYKRRKVASKDVVPDVIDADGTGYTEHIVIHRTLIDYYKTQGYKNYCDENTGHIIPWEELTLDDWQDIFEDSPWFGNTADDIDSLNRIKTQSCIQKYITSSISSTVNLPSNTTKEEISDIYMYAAEHGCKGQTVYRDGSRQGVLVNIDNKGTKGFNYSSAFKRPKKIKGVAHNTKIKGVPYNVIIGFIDNNPYEVFIFDGIVCEGEGEVFKKGRGNYEFITGDCITNITNLMNEEQATITRLISMSLRHGAAIEFIVEQLRKNNSVINSFISGLARVLSKYAKKESIKCPKCGGKLIKEGGCEKCLDCGESKCNLIWCGKKGSKSNI